MARGSNSNDGSAIYLRIADGMIVEQVEEGTANAVSRTTKPSDEHPNGRTVWERRDQYVEGVIISMFRKEREYKGEVMNSLAIRLKDVGETYQLEMNEGNRYWSSFMLRLPNLDLTKGVRFAPYDFTDKEGRRVIGMNLIQGNAKVQPKWTKDNPGDLPQGRKPMKEAPAEVTDDELEQYSEGVKKRIQHFSKGYHEERRAKEAAFREREEALRLAQALVEENKKLQGSLGQGQQVLLEQAKKVVANEVEQAKQKYKQAYESGDSDALVSAQEELTSAKIRAERVNNFKPQVAQSQETVIQPAPRPVEQPVQVDTRARAWQDANPWFGSDDEMTAVALTVHKKLVESGVDTASDEYYEKINSRVRQIFPDAFSSGKTAKKSFITISIP